MTSEKKQLVLFYLGGLLFFFVSGVLITYTFQNKVIQSYKNSKDKLLPKFKKNNKKIIIIGEVSDLSLEEDVINKKMTILIRMENSSDMKLLLSKLKESLVSKEKNKVENIIKKYIDSILIENRNLSDEINKEYNILEEMNKKIGLIIIVFITLSMLIIYNFMNSILKTIKEYEEGSNYITDNYKYKSWADMTGEMIHQMNNPLTVLKSRLLILQRLKKKNQLTSEEIDLSIKQMDNTIDKMINLINDIDEKELKKNVSDFKSIELKKVIEKVLDRTKEKFKKSGIFLKIEMDRPEWRIKVNVNYDQLVQAIMNIFSNSYDAINSLEDRWINIDCFEDELNVIIQIIDSGEGIKKEFEKNLFDPFFSTKSDSTGKGLGLSVAKSILVNHGGRIIYDKDKKNTTFLIYLPKLENRDVV